jgi:hypothetical protein
MDRRRQVRGGNLQLFYTTPQQPHWRGSHDGQRLNRSLRYTRSQRRVTTRRCTRRDTSRGDTGRPIGPSHLFHSSDALVNRIDFVHPLAPELDPSQRLTSVPGNQQSSTRRTCQNDCAHFSASLRERIRTCWRVYRLHRWETLGWYSPIFTRRRNIFSIRINIALPMPLSRAV